MSCRRVTVFGGTGFLGRRIAEAKPVSASRSQKPTGSPRLTNSKPTLGPFCKRDRWFESGSLRQRVFPNSGSWAVGEQTGGRLDHAVLSDLDVCLSRDPSRF